MFGEMLVVLFVCCVYFVVVECVDVVGVLVDGVEVVCDEDVLQGGCVCGEVCQGCEFVEGLVEYVLVVGVEMCLQCFVVLYDCVGVEVGEMFGDGVGFVCEVFVFYGGGLFCFLLIEKYDVVVGEGLVELCWGGWGVEWLGSFVFWVVLEEYQVGQ